MLSGVCTDNQALNASHSHGAWSNRNARQGLGDAEPSGGGAKPPEETEDGAVQLRTLEEPPDVAAHWDYCEYTYITVDLHSECPDHVNGYDLGGVTRRSICRPTRSAPTSAPTPSVRWS